MSSLQTYKGYLTGSYSGSQKSEVCPMPYALCPIPYAHSYLIFLRKAIPYFHVLQPNQYYQTKRVFGEAEKQIAFNKETPYAKSVQIGYPALFKKFPNLEKNNINILNAVNVFDRTKEAVYVDSCCHYNQAGEVVFSNYVGSSILESLRKDERKNKK